MEVLMMRRMGVPLSILAAIVGFGAFWYMVPRDEAFGMFEGTGHANLSRIILSFAATIGGVVLGSFHRQLRRLGTVTIPDVPAFFSQVFRSVDLWLGLAGAPVVYALLLQSTDGMSAPGLLLVGLENGFCCNVIVNAFVGKTEVDLQHGAAVVVLPKGQ